MPIKTPSNFPIVSNKNAVAITISDHVMLHTRSASNMADETARRTPRQAISSLLQSKIVTFCHLTAPGLTGRFSEVQNAPSS